MYSLAVVMPMYQSAMTVINALQSIVLQVPLPNEVILVDDASLDNTVSLVEEFISTHQLSGWCVLRCPINMGAAAARHRGVMATSARYVAFLDADDEWMPGHLARSINCMHVNGLDLYGAQFSESPYTTESNIEVLRSISLVSQLMRNHFFTSTVIVIKASYMKVGGFEVGHRYSEDYRLWLKMCAETGFKCSVSSAAHARYCPLNNLMVERLSLNHWAMQKAELSNYFYFYRLKKINIFIAFISASFSCLRYVRRLVLNLKFK